jgi:hypothetical protein
MGPDDEGHGGAQGPANRCAAGFAQTQTARVCSPVVLALALLCSAFTFYHIASSRRTLGRALWAAGIETEPVTRVCLSRSYLWLLPLLAVAGVAKENLVGPCLVTVVLNGVHLGVALAVLWLYQLAVVRPLLDIVEAVYRV